MSIIESITVNRSKVWIELDSGEKAWVWKKDFPAMDLSEGQEIDAESFSRLILTRQYRSGLDKAVEMLARRACSQGEIEKKLRTLQYDPQTIEMVVYKLQRENLLDDASFSEQWARYRSQGKYGSRRIYQELRQKGVPEETARNALESIDEEDQMAQAVLLAKKGLSRPKAGEDPRKTLQRAVNMLIRRGYDWDTAKQACQTALNELRA